MDNIKGSLIFAIIILLCFPGTGLAEILTIGDYIIEDSSLIGDLQHPSVAVALGGGGARALVNVGVLKALEEARIPVDLVVGTSMGALVAVMYGSGISAEQMEELVTELDLKRLFDLNPPFNNGLLQTIEMNYFLQRVAPSDRLEDFPIPTALLSFDLNSGKRYVASTGYIADAVQGPYAIPICFPGTEQGPYYLVDAGIQELTPAQTARLLGADMVISTTAFDELPYTDYTSSLRSFMRLINVIKEDYSIPVVQDYSDVVIAHDVGDYSFMDFQLAQEFVDLGYQQTQKQIPQIKALLAGKGIATQPAVAREKLEMEELRRDLQYDRFNLEYTLVKPHFYLDQKHSPLAKTLFREDDFQPHGGVELRSGRLRAEILLPTTGDHLEAQLRMVRLTDRTDLVGRVQRNSLGSDDWELGVIWYPQSGSYQLGLAQLKEAYYAHLQHSSELTGREWKVTGYTTALVPIGQPFSVEAAASYVGSRSLSAAWMVEPYLTISSSQLLRVPSHYRGIRGIEGEPVAQAGVDFVRTYNFSHSVELVQILQVYQVQTRYFIDVQSGKRHSQAMGAGIDINLNLLGLKPAGFGAYAAYDLEEQAAKVAWEFSLYI